MKNFRNVSLLLLLALGLWALFRKDKDVSAGPEKVLKKVIVGHVASMDPIHASDVVSCNEIAKVYEGLVAYHYLKRPYELVPSLAEEMPTVSADGLVYTFKIRQDVRFHDDPCFPDGQGRELTAADFVYSFKRLADAKLKSPLFSTIAGKIQGLDAWRKKYAKLSATDYKEEIVGLQALDKYTLQIKLVQPWPQMLYDLAYSWFSAVPREAVEHYGEEFLNHPVGTGPFVLKNYNPQGNKITYHRNPTFRPKYFPSEAAEPYKHMLTNAGKRLPFVDKIVCHIITEAQTAWLMFQKGVLDYMGIPKDMLTEAITPTNELSPALRAKAVLLQYAPGLDLYYIAFNHLDPLFSNNLKLRRALSLAYNRQEFNELFFKNRGIIAQSIIPPGVGGHQATYQNPWNKYDLKKATQLLAEAGYPGGKGLPELVLDLANSNLNRQIGEHFKRYMAKIGVRVKVVLNPGPQFLKKLNSRTTMLHMMGFTSYPEGLPFLTLLHGPAAPGKNDSNFNDAEFNTLHKRAVNLLDATQRTQIYEQMYQIAAKKVPLIYLVHPSKYTLHHSWLKNCALSLDFVIGTEQYLDIDLKKKRVMKATF